MNTHERRLRRHPIQQQQQQQSIECEPSNTSDDKETPIDYLSHNNATTLIKEAVKVLLTNRPDDPLQFLADYFAPKTNCTAVETAYDKLNWADYSMSVYQRNVLEVYDNLCSMRNEDSHLKGLLGIRFNELLEKLSADLSHRFSKLVFERLETRPNQVISFRRFYHSILLMKVLKDFVSLTKAMHQDLDVQGVGKVSKELCILVVNRLALYDENTTLMLVNANERTFARCFLTNANSATLQHTTKDVVDENEFVQMCITRFLDQVL